jgi:hypothetical protein
LDEQKCQNMLVWLNEPKMVSGPGIFPSLKNTLFLIG